LILEILLTIGKKGLPGAGRADCCLDDGAAARGVGWAWRATDVQPAAGDFPPPPLCDPDLAMPAI